MKTQLFILFLASVVSAFGTVRSLIRLDPSKIEEIASFSHIDPTWSDYGYFTSDFAVIAKRSKATILRFLVEGKLFYQRNKIKDFIKTHKLSNISLSEENVDQRGVLVTYSGKVFFWQLKSDNLLRLGDANGAQCYLLLSELWHESALKAHMEKLEREKNYPKNPLRDVPIEKKIETLLRGIEATTIAYQEKLTPLKNFYIECRREIDSFPRNEEGKFEYPEDQKRSLQILRKIQTEKSFVELIAQRIFDYGKKVELLKIEQEFGPTHNALSDLIISGMD